MKYVPKSPLPWDLVVFLAMTSVTFGYSIAHFGRDSVPMASQEDSISQSQSATDSVANASSLLDLGCLERKSGTDRLLSEGGKVRFRGKFCHVGRSQMRTFAGIKISNETNGYEGTVFLRGRDPSFVSDYMVLKKGKNTIRLEWDDPLNKRTREYVAEIFEQ